MCGVWRGVWGERLRGRGSGRLAELALLFFFAAALFALLLCAFELFDEPLDHALALQLLDARGGSQDAELRVFGDLFDEEGGLSVERWFGQRDDGGLQAVEQQACAAGVQVVGGDALQHQRDGVQDAAAVGELVGAGELKGAEAGLVGGGVLDGAARGVVLIAKLLPAQAGRGAAVAVHIDVAAAEALAGVGS